VSNPLTMEPLQERKSEDSFRPNYRHRHHQNSSDILRLLAA